EPELCRAGRGHGRVGEGVEPAGRHRVETERGAVAAARCRPRDSQVAEARDVSAGSSILGRPQGGQLGRPAEARGRSRAASLVCAVRAERTPALLSWDADPVAAREVEMVDRPDVEARSPLLPGVCAPDFRLPAADREGTVALADYRGRAPLLLGLFRGIYCPFCRRAIVRMGQAWDRLRPEGVEALAVVATTLENARLYFRFRPPKVPVAADPQFTTHRLY